MFCAETPTPALCDAFGVVIFVLLDDIWAPGFNSLAFLVIKATPLQAWPCVDKRFTPHTKFVASEVISGAKSAVPTLALFLCASLSHVQGTLVADARLPTLGWPEDFCPVRTQRMADLTYR